jgi:hypothetical protein
VGIAGSAFAKSLEATEYAWPARSSSKHAATQAWILARSTQ